jgi:hypothetical protein
MLRTRALALAAYAFVLDRTTELALPLVTVFLAAVGALTVVAIGGRAGMMTGVAEDQTNKLFREGWFPATCT